ncbi:hypothetical protein GH808_11295 [Acetobacterium fimetarium]|uniref:Uncharacterized protein n=1 Tax=Acetobacterium fimetarium TaxID=52691 RepID=A0ABR6WX01_9FIRM|nr:hypothetical protein [Acetobacterium fimetarium]MBC3805016.1 hypothetical protein [Acetobacterium fimetarium]
MEPLIKIETIPIEIKYVEKEPKRSSSAGTAEISVSQQDGLQSIRSNRIQIPVQDYFETSSAFNWSHPTYTATADYGEDGNLNLSIQMEDEESRAIRFQQSTRSIDSMARLVATNTQDNNRAGSMEISFKIPGLQSGKSSADNLDTQFYPPDLELVVTQRPEVIITYIGGPIYVPRSADPDYKPTESDAPLYFPQSADPDYKPVEDEGPLYFPQSADPDYKPVENEKPIYFPESADPDYRSEPEIEAAQKKEGLKLDQSV